MDQQQPRPVCLFARLSAFAGLTLAAVVACVVVGGLVLPAFYSTATSETAGVVALAVAMLGISWVSVALFEKRPLAVMGIGFDRPWAKHTVGGSVLGAAMVAVVCGALRWLGLVSIELGGSCGAILGVIVGNWVQCLSVAAVEELICRGYAFQILARRNLGVALALSGMVFILLHMFNTGASAPVAIANLLIVHLFFAFLYLRTRSLWLPIAVHAGWNFTLGTAFGMSVSGAAQSATLLRTTAKPGLWAGQEFGVEGGLAVTFLLLFALALSARFIPRRRPALDLLASSELVREVPEQPTPAESGEFPPAPIDS